MNVKLAIKQLKFMALRLSKKAAADDMIEDFASDSMNAWESIAEWAIDSIEKAQVFAYVANEQKKGNKEWGNVQTKLKSIEKQLNDVLHTMQAINPEGLEQEMVAAKVKQMKTPPTNRQVAAGLLDVAKILTNK